MRGWLLAGMVVTLLMGAAGCADRGQTDQASWGAAAGHDQPLTRTEWQLTQVVAPSRTWSPPPDVDAVLRFDGEGGWSATACNHYGGQVRIDAGLLRLGQVLGTQMKCSGPRGDVEAAFVDVMEGEVRWAIGGEELRLDKPDGRGLRLRVRDTIYPMRDLRPLLQGRRHGGDYRFGWRPGDGSVLLDWEWRDAPGKPWGFAGMNRERTGPVPRPDVLTAGAGHEQFVFGIVPRATARVVYQPPAGHPTVALELLDVPGPRTWHAFGGFVKQPRQGSVVVAFDGHGRELGRSHRLLA